MRDPSSCTGRYRAGMRSVPIFPCRCVCVCVSVSLSLRTTQTLTTQTFSKYCNKASQSNLPFSDQHYGQKEPFGWLKCIATANNINEMAGSSWEPNVNVSSARIQLLHGGSIVPHPVFRILQPRNQSLSQLPNHSS